MELQLPSSTPNWSNIVKDIDQPNNIHPTQTVSDRVFVENCNSTNGIAVAVVDANAIIQGGERLIHSADRFVSVPEVINEVRDPASRHSLNFLPFTIDTMEPAADALKKVIEFARETGELQALSDVDLKLIALAYTLEAQIHGTEHLRDNPPPIHAVNVKRLPEKDMPGWGDNVPNLAEWEALENATETGSNVNSKILPTKDLSLSIDEQSGSEVGPSTAEIDNHSRKQEDGHDAYGKPRRYMKKKKEVKIEGKKMVADGLDASQGQFDDNDDGWFPAVSRSTHRRFLRRKARREMHKSSCDNDGKQDAPENIESINLDDERCPDLLLESADTAHAGIGCLGENETIDSETSCEHLSTILSQMRLEEELLKAPLDAKDPNYACEGIDTNESSTSDVADNNITKMAVEVHDAEICNETLEQFDKSSRTNGSVDISYDNTSEQSWMLKSLSDSSVACVTGDFAMQNVLLQMGLRLLAPGGMQIRELHRWILKCHACFKITKETGRIFCPSCGNGGTLRKVAIRVGENGIVLSERRSRFSLRGTKFSLPLPQGGRYAITKNPILREDQLPQKFLYPKKKNKNKQGEDIFVSDNIFLHQSNKNAPLRPPVRKTLAVFSQKRNPNDNHYSRSLH